MKMRLDPDSGLMLPARPSVWTPQQDRRPSLMGPGPALMGGGAAAPTGDPLRAYQVLHLPGNGSNGGTTFTDYSPAARTPDSVVSTVVTDTGNAKFGTASMNFTSGRILYADSNDWDWGAGDYLVRFWVQFNATGIGARCFVCGQAASNGGQGSWSVVKGTDDRLVLNFRHSGGTVATANVNVVLSVSTWYWFEGHRTGSTLYASVGGATPFTASVSGLTMDASTAKFGVGGLGEYTGGGYGGVSGDRHAGWLADFQAYKGVGGHTASFTPPPAEMPTT